MVKGSSPPEALLWVLQAVAESTSLEAIFDTHLVNEMEAKHLAQVAAWVARAFAAVKRLGVREKSVGVAQEVPAQEVPLTPKTRQGAAKRVHAITVAQVKVARGTAGTVLRMPTSEQP